MKLLAIMAAGAIAAGNLNASEYSDNMNARAISSAINDNTIAIYSTGASRNYGSWEWPRSKKAQQRIDAEREAAWERQKEQWREEAKQAKLEDERRETYRKNRDAYNKEQEEIRFQKVREHNARINACIFFNAAVANGTVEIRKALPAK